MTNEAQKPSGAVTVIAIYHFLEAALSLFVLAVAGFAGLVVLFAAPSDPGVGVALLVLAFVALVALVIAAVNIATGCGLLVLRPWARWAAVILSVLRLPSFPIGTVIGGLIIYYLVQDEARDLFEAH